MYKDSVKLIKTKQLRTRLQHLMGMKRRDERRREARRRAADGALAALPTTEASTDGALGAVDAALGRQDPQEQVEDTRASRDRPSAVMKSLEAELLSSLDSKAEADEARSGVTRASRNRPSGDFESPDAQLLSSLVSGTKTDAASSKAADHKLAAGASKTVAALASLDADLLFSSDTTALPLKRRKHGARISQLGFQDYGVETEGPEARARWTDDPAEEEDDDECRPPMVMYKGKCIDSPSRQPRPWGLPTRKR